MTAHYPFKKIAAKHFAVLIRKRPERSFHAVVAFGITGEETHRAAAAHFDMKHARDQFEAELRKAYEAGRLSRDADPPQVIQVVDCPACGHQQCLP